jgi:hypothetical protein
MINSIKLIHLLDTPCESVALLQADRTRTSRSKAVAFISKRKQNLLTANKNPLISILNKKKRLNPSASAESSASQGANKDNGTQPKSKTIPLHFATNVAE